jgi:hypothetical protein
MQDLYGHWEISQRTAPPMNHMHGAKLHLPFSATHWHQNTQDSSNENNHNCGLVDGSGFQRHQYQYTRTELARKNKLGTTMQHSSRQLSFKKGIQIAPIRDFSLYPSQLSNK